MAFQSRSRIWWQTHDRSQIQRWNQKIPRRRNLFHGFSKNERNRWILFIQNRLTRCSNRTRLFQRFLKISHQRRRSYCWIKRIKNHQRTHRCRYRLRFRQKRLKWWKKRIDLRFRRRNFRCILINHRRRYLRSKSHRWWYPFRRRRFRFQISRLLCCWFLKKKINRYQKKPQSFKKIKNLMWKS